MYTAYTNSVRTGEVKTLEKFALRCARAFGVLADLRDEPLDSPLPKKIKIDRHYYESLELAEAHIRLVRESNEWLDKLRESLK